MFSGTNWDPPIDIVLLNICVFLIGKFWRSRIKEAVKDDLTDRR
jgi:hypothetical protein